MTDVSDTALWRQAIEICESLAGQNRQQVMAALAQMDLSQDLLEKIIRIIDNMSASNPLLDEHDYQSLIDNLKQGNHLIGKQIDGYLIKKLIAKGGMSTVYEAAYVQAKHQKPVAIKLLSPYGITDKAIELFNREQLILSKLSHPAIVAFHHSGITQDGTHYLVMEYLQEAKNVVDYSHDNQLNKQQILTLVASLCEVFAYTHQKHVIHRDIKPGNILVDQQGQVKVIDFGIGRLEQLEGHTLTQVFTPGAAAPEQLLGQGVSEHTDVFSLGALLLQLLVKQKPLPKTDFKNYDPQNDHKHINRLLKNSDLDNDLKNIIRTAMHTDPKLRYNSMNAFAEDIQHWLNHEPVNASADGWMYRIKKLVIRNQLLTVGLVVILALAMVGVLVISNLGDQKQVATGQRDRSFALLEAMIDQANPVENHGLTDGEAIIRSLNTLAEQQAALLQSDPELSDFFYRQLGSVFNSKGLYHQALESYQKSLQAKSQYQSPNDDEYLDTELTIANLLETTGEYQKAKEKGEQLVSKLTELNVANPRHLLNAYYLLSKIHQYMAENDVAYAYGKKALSWLEQHPEIDAKMQATLFNSLAVTNRNMGQMAAAEQFYIKAIGLLKPFKESQIELSSIMVNYAILKGRAGDLEASEKLFLEAFEVIKRIDEKHPHLAMAYLPYSTLLNVSGRIGESKALLEDAMSMLQVNGEKRYLASAHMKLARVGLYQNDIDLAFENLTAALTLNRELTGEDHPDVFDLYNMALWVLMSEPYQTQAQKLIDLVDAKLTHVSLGSREFIRFQVQKDFLNQRSTDYQIAESVFANFLFDVRKQDKDKQLKWIEQQLELYGSSKLSAAWLQLQQALLLQDVSAVAQLCQSAANWNNSSQLYFKTLMMQSCLSFEAVLSTAEKIKLTQQLKEIKATNEYREDLVSSFIATVAAPTVE